MLNVKRYWNLVRYISNWPLYLKSRYTAGQNEILTFLTRSGLTLKVPRQIRGEFRGIFLDESYMTHMVSDFPKNSVIIDIGANVGIFSLYMAFRFATPRIFAFEPIPTNFEQLRINAELNKAYSKIVCHQKAVSDQSGEITLSYQHDEGFTVMASMLNAHTQQSIKVCSSTLREILDENNITHCDLLKLDCEGAEYGILYGCPQNYLSRISHIAMEVHRGEGPEQNIEAMQSFLNKHGFKTRTDRGQMLWAYRDE